MQWEERKKKNRKTKLTVEHIQVGKVQIPIKHIHMHAMGRSQYAAAGQHERVG
jgi:uncharacterized protein YpmS